MALWDSTKISIQQFYTNTATAPTSNSTVLLWRNWHHFWSYSIHSHIRSLLLRGLCHCFTMHRDTGGCAFVFWGTFVQKLLGACKNASLMRMLHASAGVVASSEVVSGFPTMAPETSLMGLRWECIRLWSAWLLRLEVWGEVIL